MKHTLDNGKTVNIPDAAIEKYKATLGLDTAEAIELYLSDEGIEVDETVVELTDKAKAAGTGAKAQGEKKERKAPVRKPDELKRALIEALLTSVQCFDETDGIDVANVTITNIERMIAFEVGDEKFELTLTKKRKPKE